jgi:hypothetical protein
MKRVYRRSQPVRVLHTRVHMQNHNPPLRWSARMIPNQPQQHLGFRAREDSRSRENSRYEFTDLCFPERAGYRSYALSSNTSRKMPRAASQIEWVRSKNTCLARLSSVSPCLRARCWVAFANCHLPIAICRYLPSSNSYSRDNSFGLLRSYRRLLLHTLREPASHHQSHHAKVADK